MEAACGGHHCSPAILNYTHRRQVWVLRFMPTKTNAQSREDAPHVPAWKAHVRWQLTAAGEQSRVMYLELGVFLRYFWHMEVCNDKVNTLFQGRRDLGGIKEVARTLDSCSCCSTWFDT